MSADKLGGGVDHDVCPVLNGPDQIGGAEGVVDDQGQAMAVSNVCDGINVRDVAVGVAQSFQIDGFGVGLDGGGEFLQAVSIHKGGGYTELRQSVSQQIIAAAVDGFLGHDMIPRLGQSLNGVGNRRRAGGQGQSSHAAFQSCDTLFQNILGGIGQPAIDVACIRQTKPGGGVSGIVEHITGGLIDGYRPGVGGRICLFLTCVELDGLELIAAHRNTSFLF